MKLDRLGDALAFCRLSVLEDKRSSEDHERVVRIEDTLKGYLKEVERDNEAGEKENRSATCYKAVRSHPAN